ncbi:MAG: methylmalonyl Co-A mutase-associated GTPase MeaB [Balneolaceae bacterium]|nr:methylmalonyl Co-A mutase-associated GTPase MeaB [Balneolaceae bacterium]
MPKKKKNNQVFDSVNPSYKQKRGQLRSAEEYVSGIRSGDRTILSMAITIIESSKDTHQQLAREIIRQCLPFSGNSVRIGITGVPGVGKSSFIEAIGRQLIEDGRKLAVLTIDPSSTLSKGSILGDKTRMPLLSTNENAFIRPSPTSGSLGGVARKTRETIILCEAAGFDTIFIETVGVGQSETSVKSMVDLFLLLMLAGAGDELQGIKRGIMEMADILAINKADGENIQSAKQAKLEYENGLSLLPPAPSGRRASVHICSALEGSGISEIRDEINNFIDETKESNYFHTNRENQAVYWLHQTVEEQLKQQFHNNPAVKKVFKLKEKEVKKGLISPFAAAQELLKLAQQDSAINGDTHT